MIKGKEEDELLDMTLKAIEIVAISEMAQEKDNLENKVEALMAKKAENDTIEEALLREKARNIARLRGESVGKVKKTRTSIIKNDD